MLKCKKCSREYKEKFLGKLINSDNICHHCESNQVTKTSSSSSSFFGGTKTKTTDSKGNTFDNCFFNFGTIVKKD